MELVEGPTLAERIGGRAVPLNDLRRHATPSKEIAPGLRRPLGEGSQSAIHPSR